MIEIKFRAWQSFSKHMYPNKSIGVLAKNIKDDKVWKYMQFIGLKDKNGIEIYEGDIIKSPMTDSNVVVEYDLTFAQYTYGGCEFNVESKLNDIEVIGNIYENPYLITSET